VSDPEVSELLERESIFREEERIDPRSLELKEELISLNRVAKVVKGGRRFSFAALVVVGDGKCHVGLGFGKANEVPEAISKAVESGKKKLFRVSMLGRTIPHETMGEFGAARVMLKPAAEGTGLIAGAAVRMILLSAGIHDILTKSLGSDNVLNVSKATIEGLKGLKNPEKEARLRGKKIEELYDSKRVQRLKAGMPASSGPEISKAPESVAPEAYAWADDDDERETGEAKQGAPDEKRAEPDSK